VKAESAAEPAPAGDGLGWSEPELAELARIAPGLLPGRIMTCDPVGALVLTEIGATAATYCASLLVAAARARSAGRLWPKPGDRVALRRWPDGPVTVEGVVA
jgi:ribosome biogenesis GTPase